MYSIAMSIDVPKFFEFICTYNLFARKKHGYPNVKLNFFIFCSSSFGSNKGLHINTEVRIHFFFQIFIITIILSSVFFHQNAGLIINDMFRSSTVILIAAAVLALFSIVTQAAAIQARGGSNSGHATFYNVKKSGKPSCGGDADNNDMVVAVSKHRMPHGHGKPCGEKMKVKGPKGSVTVKVVDTCPECDKDDIDLSPKAFERIGKKNDGRVKIEWSFK
jgi:hypothetical protein